MKPKQSPGLRIPLLAACVGVGVGAGCGRELPSQQALWSVGSEAAGPRGHYAAGDVAPAARDGAWVVFADRSGSTAARVKVLQASERSDAEPILATFEGESPSLLEREDGKLVVVSAQPTPHLGAAIVLREGSKDGRTWSAPRRIGPRPVGYFLSSGRLVRTAGGDWLLPAIHADTLAEDRPVEVVCLRSRDAGATWAESVVMRATHAGDPAIAETQGDALLLVLRLGVGLARSVSADGGATWSIAEPIGIPTDALPHALERLSGGVALAWTDPPADSTAWAVPPLRTVRLAVSTDAGRTWHRMTPLAWRAGCAPAAVALAFTGDHLTALIEGRCGIFRDLACLEYQVRGLDPVERYTSRARGSYAIEPARVADALELLCEQTLARPEPSKKLFIEGYFMRTLVAAHEALRSAGGAAEPLVGRHRTVDTSRGLTQAVGFADWMLRGQDARGYWPLGYKAIYVADMAAVVGLFTALEQHVDPDRRRAYVEATRRFAAALERDGMILPTGACGVGWPETRDPTESAAVRTPYLVSTGLAGIEVHAWLHARTGEAQYRERALAALDYTLSQLRPDGSFPGADVGEEPEGSFVAAAYVEEGWMAADVFLQDSQVRERLTRVLPPHVAWLLRTQRPDGTWGDRGPGGEFARTPAIVDFLIWYDQRCQASEDVRRAVRRASATLANPDTWYELGLARAGRNEEVMRAIAGRPLAAMAAGRFVM